MSTDEQSVTGVRRFRRRPLEVTAIQWTGSNLAEVQEFAGRGNVDERLGQWADGQMHVWNDQEHAWIPCPLDHWVMRGVLGEFYPVSPAALEATYQAPDVPADVLQRLASYFKNPTVCVERPAPVWGGKTASQWVADGDGTWNDVIAEYDRMFRHFEAGVTQ